MSMTEKVAYLRGLADGMKLGDDDKDRLLKAIIDTLGEMAETVDDIDGDLDAFCEQLDAVDEDLADLEEFIYEEDIDYDDWDEDFGYGEELYDVECPSCGEVITFDEEILDEGSIECPACGELLEFDIEFDDEDEADDE